MRAKVLRSGVGGERKDFLRRCGTRTMHIFFFAMVREGRVG